VFRNTYSYKGEQKTVRHWSVKIQHQGERKTFALKAKSKARAIVEACRLYRSLLESSPPGAAGLNGVDPAANRFELDYWAQRLVRREPRPGFAGRNGPELSVRIEHEGQGYYFPLGAAQPKPAAARALRVYRAVVADGWPVVNTRFSRELTIALRWLDNPLAWTYMTLHTLAGSQPPPAPAPRSSPAVADVAVVESDPGIRAALARCVNEMAGFRCALAPATAAEALRESERPRRPLQLALVSYTLADDSGAACLERLKKAAPQTAAVLYSIYEDSEELFRTTPGGASSYLLRRTPCTEFLDPVKDLSGKVTAGGDPLARCAWEYFKNTFGPAPSDTSPRQLTSLTHREHDVLGLLSKGHPDKEIAQRLAISIHTVHEHVKNIFEKLAVHNRTEAVVKYLQK
jgi:DNA-binding NarL/FixJ family response regulator